MDNIFCKSKNKEKIIILDLISLNLIQIILTVCIIVLMTSCAPPTETPLWVQSLKTLPKVEGYIRAGVFEINGKLYVQNCDSVGNQMWQRYNEKTQKWRQSRYNTLGCVDGERSTGPNSG